MATTMLWVDRPGWAADDADKEAHNLLIFDAAWKAVDRNYYDREARRKDWIAIGASARPLAAKAPDDGDLYLNILWPMLQRLGDSHLSAIPPKMRIAPAPPNPQSALSAHADSVEPPTRGLGFSYRIAGGEAWIVDISRGSPMDRADLEPGDAIKEMEIGPPMAEGARFHGVFERSGGGTVKVAYRWIPQDRTPVASRHLASGRLLLRFDAFDRASADWLIGQLRTAPSEGVVLDLRQNAGGRASVEHRVLGALLGPDLETGVRVDGRRRVQRSSGPRVYGGPIAVMVGPNTASAAEASAAALRHHGRAIIVGQRTAGALLVSRDFDLPGGGTLQIPVADYFTPSGERLEGRGLVPDREVRQTLAAIRTERDLVVEAAEAELGDQSLATRAEDDAPPPTARSSPPSPASPRR